MGRQEKNGSPVKPGGQEHVGMWLMTEQSAPVPHVPGHGSAHLKRIQASAGAQSGFVSHSLRQPLYGSPSKPAKHVHDPTPFLLVHSALAPHGEGKHGSVITGVRSVAVDKSTLFSVKSGQKPS